MTPALQMFLVGALTFVSALRGQAQTGQAAIAATERDLATVRAKLAKAKSQRDDLQQQRANLEWFQQISRDIQDEYASKRKPLQDAFEEYMTTYRMRYVPEERAGTPAEAEMLKAERERVNPDLRSPKGLLADDPRALTIGPGVVVRNPVERRAGAYADRYNAAEINLEKARQEFWPWRDQLDVRIGRNTDLTIQRDAPNLVPTEARTPHNYDELLAAGPKVAETIQEIDRRTASLDEEIYEQNRGIGSLEARLRQLRAQASSAPRNPPAGPPAASPPAPQPPAGPSTLSGQPTPPAVDPAAAVLARVAAFENVVATEEQALNALRDAAVAACLELNARAWAPGPALQNAQAALSTLRGRVNDVQLWTGACAGLPGSQAALQSLVGNLQSDDTRVREYLDGARRSAEACTSEQDASNAQRLYDAALSTLTKLYRQREILERQQAGLKHSLKQVGEALARWSDAPGLRATVAAEVGRYNSLVDAYNQKAGELRNLKAQFDQRRGALLNSIAIFRASLPPPLPADAEGRLAPLEARAMRIGAIPDCQAPSIDPVEAGREQELLQEADRLLAQGTAAASSCPALDLDASVNYELVLLVGAEDIPQKIAACRTRLATARPGPGGGQQPPGSTGRGYVPETTPGTPVPGQEPGAGGSGFSSRGGENRSSSQSTPETTNPPQVPEEGGGFSSRGGSNSMGLLGVTSGAGNPSPDDQSLRDSVSRTLNNASLSQPQQQLGAPPYMEPYGPSGAPPTLPPGVYTPQSGGQPQGSQPPLGVGQLMQQLGGQLADEIARSGPRQAGPGTSPPPQAPPGFQVQPWPQNLPLPGTAGLQTPPQGSTPSARPPAPSGQTSRVDCLARYCPNCRQSVSLLGASAGIDCERCKERNRVAIANCAGTAPAAARPQLLQGGSCVYKEQVGGTLGYGHMPASKYQVDSCDVPHVGWDRVYGPDTLEKCQAYVQAQTQPAAPRR